MDWKDILYNSFKDKYYNFKYLEPKKVYVQQSLLDCNANEIDMLKKKINSLESALSELGLQLKLENEEKRRIGTDLEILINEQNQLR